MEYLCDITKGLHIFACSLCFFEAEQAEDINKKSFLLVTKFPTQKSEIANCHKQ